MILKKFLANEAEALLEEQDLVFLRGGLSEGEEGDINFNCPVNTNCDICTINRHWGCGN